MGTFLSDDATPRADTTVTHRALGVLKAGLKETCEAWVQISHSKYDTSEIICTIQVRDDWKSRGLPMDSVHEWIIEAESPARHLIRLWPRGRRRYSGASAFLELGAYELTPYPDELSADDNFQVTVELTRKGFLPTNPGRVLYFNGTIQQHGEAPPPLRWKHLGIENELFVRYTYERALAAGDEAFLQVERPCILQKRRGTSPGSIYDTIEAIKSEIGDYLLVASLISREPVKWYQIETVRVPGAREHVGLPGLLRRITTERSPSRDELPLIEYDSLREGLFQQMVTALRESPFSDAIRRSVSFEVASWTERGLENAYVLCQAALEAVVGVLEKEVALLAESNNVPWKKIMKALTGSIEMVGEEEKLSDDVIKLIKSKLPELERPPIADQIIFHATRLAIEKNDLWPSSVGFEEGLRSALRQRNLLVHAAHIQDPSEAYRNLVRMRELAERFILAVLGVRQEEVG